MTELVRTFQPGKKDFTQLKSVKSEKGKIRRKGKKMENQKNVEKGLRIVSSRINS